MNIDKISSKIAKELNLPESKVSIINRVQYKFLLEIIQAGDFNPVHLIYLGKFHQNSRYKNQKEDDRT